MRIVRVWALIWVGSLVTLAVRAAPDLSYRVIATYPHDTTAFTEGLAIDHGRLYESTGRNGASRIVIRDLATMQLVNSRALEDRDFGEGLTVVGREIMQLTWKGGVGYRYDLNLRRTGSFPISSEGWGLTYDGRQLIRSDGSSSLQMLNPQTFRETRRVTVRDGTTPVTLLNELEYAGGEVYANVWMSNRIAVIRPRDGQVSGWLDLSELHARLVRPDGWSEAENVLNGIAYDRASHHFFVTGKCWPTLFEIAVDPPLP